MDARPDDLSRHTDFLAILVEDVIAAQERLKSAASQTARRDVVRASLAAMEGMTWEAREHVRQVLSSLEQLTPVADLALREKTVAVSANGKVAEQLRGLPLPTAIHLIVAQAQIVSPELSVEFSGAGWSNLLRAIEVRNRITHPKPGQNLAIADDDLEAVNSGLLWLIATVEYVMASANLAAVRYNNEFRELLERLRTGDPEALAAYEAALREFEPEG